MISIQELKCYNGSNPGLNTDCILLWIYYSWHLLLGGLPIIFIAADIWRAFKKRKHWIPPVSLVLSSFSLQLLILLNKSPGFSTELGTRPYCDSFESYFDSWKLTLAGRVSVCVFMGCLLPAAASPLSPNMWTDMTTLILSTSVSVLQIVYDIYTLVKYRGRIRDCMLQISPFIDFKVNVPIVMWSNVTILVSMIVLVVLLWSGAVASIGIHQIVCCKLPIIFTPQKFDGQFSWENVEDHIINSVFVVHSCSPKYILARSVLTSPIALITVICNGIMIHESLSHPMDVSNNMEMPLVLGLIMLGSSMIFWRCITAPIYYPKKISWKWSCIKQYFKMENFWLSYLEELEDRSLRVEGMGINRLKKLMNQLWRARVLPILLGMLIWMQTILVLYSKVCWLVFQVCVSNKYMESFFMNSASQEFSYLHREIDQLGIVPGKASELVQLPGECPAGIWIANRKSIEYIKKQMKKRKGKEDKLMSLLKYTSPDLRGQKHAKPHQTYRLTGLEVERDLDVCKPSFKMAVVSIVTLMAELASFISTIDHNYLINKIIEACSQAWNIMDIVEDSTSDAAMLSKSADKLFQDLQKSCKCQLTECVSNPVEAAKASIQNVQDKAKKMAEDYKSRKWEEVAAGYRLYWLCSNLNYQQFTSVKEIVDKMCSVLADVVASCIVKAVGVAMGDCKKWAARYDEENILNVARVVGKVRNLMENMEWQLKWSFSSNTQFVETSIKRPRNRRPFSLKKRITINLPRKAQMYK